MVRSRLLTIVVLDLTLLFYISVQSFETGYRYGNEHVEQSELYKDLKCGYLFGGYTQMRLIRVLLDDHNTDLKVLFDTVSSMNNVLRSQIISLFGVIGIRIGAMWELYLFTSLITDFYQVIRYTQQDHPKINESLVYVIGKLQEDLAGCREGNKFDSYEMWTRSRQTLDLFDYRKNILRKCMEQARGLLEKNGMNSDYSLMFRLDLNTRINSLFMHDLGVHDTLKYDLQNVYNLQIKWNNTGATLSAAWQNARALDWKNTNLRHIKSYYNACYDFLKIIMFRLTLKHMEYLRLFIGTLGPYKSYAHEWSIIVVRFGSLMNLSEDRHVKNLLHVLENLINEIENIDSVVRYITVKLDKLCQPFGCEASAPFVIDNQEFKTKHTSLTEKEIQSLQITFNPVPIRFNSLMNARTFLSHLNTVFNNVNFTVIRSLLAYIDELNPTICNDLSEDCAEGLEHHHINIADFE